MQTPSHTEELIKKAAVRIMDLIRDEPIERITVRREGSMGNHLSTEIGAFDAKNAKLDISRNGDLENAILEYTRLREHTVQALYDDCGGSTRINLSRGVALDGKICIVDETRFDQYSLVPDFVRKMKSTTLADLRSELKRKCNDAELIDDLLNRLSDMDAGTNLRIEISDSKTEGHHRFLTDEHGNIDPDFHDETFEMFQALAARTFPGYENTHSDHDGGVVTLSAKQPMAGETEVEFSQWNLDRRAVMKRENLATYKYIEPTQASVSRKGPYFPF